MQSPKEQQGDIRKSSSATNAKKYRKTTEWERLEISSRKLEIPTFHANMGSINDRNAMDLTEAEDIKKRWERQGRKGKIYLFEYRVPKNSKET